MSPEPRTVVARFAGLVAPAVDRVFVGGMAAARERGGREISLRYGGPPATGYLVEFRTKLAAPDGAVGAAGFAAVTRYRDADECRRVLDRQVAHGMLIRDENGTFRATERGRQFLAEIAEAQAAALREVWEADHAARVARLAETLGRLVATAAQTAPGDGAFAAMTPVHEPLGTPPGVLLLNRLGTLRYHRADAHAAAWTAAGHTAPSIAALPPGPPRTAIEAETDRLAAPPYTALTADERLALLADLAALPG